VLLVEDQADVRNMPVILFAALKIGARNRKILTLKKTVTHDLLAHQSGGVQSVD
jgi:hypothetical protein